MALVVFTNRTLSLQDTLQFELTRVALAIGNIAAFIIEFYFRAIIAVLLFFCTWYVLEQHRVAREREAAHQRAADKWGKLVRKAHRVRSLQRYWGYLGQHLQRFPDSLRDRLREVFPTPPQRR